MLSKEVSSTIFKVFGMKQPEIEPPSSRTIGEHPVIGLVGRVFAIGLGDRGSILGRVIPKTLKKLLFDTSLLNTQHYKVRIEGKVEQSRERSSILPYTLV